MPINYCIIINYIENKNIFFYEPIFYLQLK